MPVQLPDELWLHILEYVPPKDTWMATRRVNHQFSRLAEDCMTNISEAASPIRMLTIGLMCSLGAGLHHRWYDIRGTITFSFCHFSRHNPQYALFGASLVLPDSCHARVMEKWRQIAARGVGAETEWRVQFGHDVKAVRLPKLVVADGEGVWCDWRELFDTYFGSTL